jgi:hypothetical protein
MVGTLHQALVALHKRVQRPRRPAVAPVPALPLALGLGPGLTDGVVAPVALRLVGAVRLGAPAAGPRPAVDLRPVAAGAGADPRPACAT